MTSINTVYNIAACAAGVDNQDKMNKAVSPKGVLEYIVNFFTFGGVRKKNEELYRQINHDILLSINSSKTLYDFTKTGVITLDNVQGNIVTFTLPGNNNQSGMVLVNVSNGKHEAKGEIPGDKFKYLLATTVMRSGANGLSPIMEDNEDETGFVFDEHYIDDTFKDHIRIYNERYGSVDSAIDEALIEVDVEDVNSIIQEGGIFSVSNKDTPAQPS